MNLKHYFILLLSFLIAAIKFVAAQSCFTSLTSSTTNATCGSSNGSASVSVTGGSTPYTYNWSSGASTNTATGLSAGAYTVTVTSAAGGSTTFWTENFTSGGTGWTLNISSGTNDTYSNEWVINSDYSSCTQCGTSGGNLLHITCSSLDATFCPLFGGPSCVYNAGGIDPILTDKYVSSPDISTTGKTNMTLKFWYQSFGQAGGDYGKVRLSNDGGGTWTDLAASYANTSACTQASVSIPASYENIANFRVGFRWINNDNSNGNDPPFSIDDVELWSPAGGGCDSVVTVTVNQNTALTLSATTVNAGCGLSNGTATVTSSNGTAPFTYLWNDGGTQTTSTATGLAAGSYSVTVTSSEGCTGTASATVSSNAGPSATTSSTPASCGNNNGTATANASGGTSPYTYLWSDGGGQSTSTATGLSSGSYSVTVSDAGGCTATASATVSTSGGLSLSMAATTTNCTSNTGTATATPSGGTNPYTYSWSNSQSTSTATGLAAGNISVTVTDAGGCTGTSSVTVNTASGPTVSTSSTPTACAGNTGTATATPSGGVSPYTYGWSNSQSTSTATGLSAGSYGITVTDAAGCTGTSSATVSTASGPTVSASSTPTACAGNTGTATATPSGGVSPYTYTWSVSQSTSTITGLASGNYSVTVTDANGCTGTGSATVTNAGSPTITTSSTDASCTSNTGTASATASGGTPPYSYSWNDGGNQSASTATGLGPGNYSVTVTDAGGCTVTGSATVNSPGAPTLTTSQTPASCGASNGTATVTASNSTPPYTYLWCNGATTSNATGLSSGNCSVTVTGAAGASTPFWTETFDGANGAWTLNLNGPGTNDAMSNEWVINGDYSACTQCGTSGGNLLHITCSSLDGTFCPLMGGPSCVYNAGGIDPILTDKYVSSPDISTVGKTNITMKFWYGSNGESGNDYGLVRLSSDGGATWTDLAFQYAGLNVCLQKNISIPATYENISNFRIAFRWVNNDNSAGNDPPFSIDDIELSTPSGGGCSATATVNVGQTNTLTLSSSSTNPSCGQSNGIAIVTPASGASPYTFSWQNGQSASSATGLAAGSYAVTVTDAGGCTATTTVSLSSSGGPSLSMATSDPLCNGGATGVATVAPSGGTPPYTYNWSNGKTTQINMNVAAGTYYVTVSDAGGCNVIDSAIIVNPIPIYVSFTIQDANCGVTDGFAQAAVDSGGTSPYSYQWSNGSTSFFNGNIGAGTYFLTVTDANGCKTTDTALVSNIGAATVTINTITNLSCNGNSNGAISINVSGGTPPLTYMWSNGTTTQNLSGVSAGSYTISVSDVMGCITIANATITEPPAIVIVLSSANVNCSGSNQLTVTVSGGVPGYSLVWNTGSNNDTISGLSPGTYSITVTDSTGCTKSASEVINAPIAVDAGKDTTIFAGDNAPLKATATGGNPPLSYNWTPGNLSAQNTTVTPPSTTTYTVAVTDADSCTATDSLTITVIECDEPFVPSAFSPNNDKINDMLYIRGLSVECYDAMSFIVYNRWGQKVFETTSSAKGWDGTINGKNADTEVFVYYLNISYKNGETKTLKGNTTLVR